MPPFAIIKENVFVIKKDLFLLYLKAVIIIDLISSHTQSLLNLKHFMLTFASYASFHIY